MELTSMAKIVQTLDFAVASLLVSMIAVVSIQIIASHVLFLLFVATITLTQVKPVTDPILMVEIVQILDSVEASSPVKMTSRQVGAMNVQQPLSMLSR